MKRFILSIIFLVFAITPVMASITTDGAASYLSGTATFTTLASGTELTACAWVSPASLADGIVITKVTDPTGGWYTFYLGATAGASGSAWFSISNSGGVGVFPYWEAANLSMVAGSKHRICANWKRVNGTVTDGSIYYDGASQTITTFTSNSYDNTFTLQNASAALSLGARKYDTPDSFFNGTFSGLSIWSKQLTSGEQTTDYNGGNPAPCQNIPTTIQPASLIFYAPLDDRPSGVITTSPMNIGTVPIAFSNFVSSPTWSTSMNCCRNSILGKGNYGKMNLAPSNCS